MATKVYLVYNKYDANAMAYIVNNKHEADIMAYIVHNKYDAQMKVYVVDSKYDADIKIFIVDNPYETKGSLCFITSACVESMGLPDYCYELTVLRNFRDMYLVSTESGRSDITRYYEIAPRILKRLYRMPDASVQLRSIYKKMILPAVELVGGGRYKEAHAHYADQLRNLLNRLGIDRSSLRI